MSAISEALAPLPEQFVVMESTVAAALATSPAQLVSANPLRWALIIGAPIVVNSGQAQPSWAGPNRNTVANGAGIPLGPNQGPLRMDFREYGILVQQAWYGASLNIANTGPWEIIEVLIQQ